LGFAEQSDIEQEEYIQSKDQKMKVTLWECDLIRIRFPATLPQRKPCVVHDWPALPSDAKAEFDVAWLRYPFEFVSQQIVLVVRSTFLLHP